MAWIRGIVVAAVLAVAFSATAAASVAAASGSAGVLRGTPGEVGVSSQAILDMMEGLEGLPETEIHHLMVIRHGRVVAEGHAMPFSAEDSHTLYSASKTFTGMAVGLCVDDNLLRIDDRLAIYFPDLLPDTVSANLAQITVRDLLMMNAGIRAGSEMGLEHDWARAWLAKPVKRPAKFAYDSMCTYMLSCIVQRLTGKTVLALLQERIFTPMGITDAQWEVSPDGVTVGGWGLRLTTEDLARVAVLWLNRGAWNGQQLISAQWIEQMEARHIDCAAPGAPLNDRNVGYCYQMWRSTYPGSVRFDGAYGQYIAMVPERDVAVVLLGVSHAPYDELKVIWDNLMPGVHDTPLTSDPAAKKLQKRLAHWTLPTPKGRSKVKAASAINGRTLTLNDNNHGISTLTLDGKQLTLRYSDRHSERIALGTGSWARRSALTGFPPADFPNTFRGLVHDYQVTGAMAWTDDHTLTIELQYVNWISATRIVIDTAASTITLTDNFAPKKAQTVAYKL